MEKYCLKNPKKLDRVSGGQHPVAFGLKIWRLYARSENMLFLRRVTYRARNAEKWMRCS